LDDVADLAAPGNRAAEAVLRGAALCALGRDAEGTALLQHVAQGATGRERTEAAYELAKAHRRAGRLDQAEAMLAPLVDACRAAGCDPVVAQALELYGRIELERRRRPVAARHFLEALEVRGHLPAPSGALEASLLHGLAVISVETLDLRLYARVRRDLEAFSWPPGSATVQAAAQRLRIVGELLSGNEPAAWAMACEAMRIAPAGSRYAAALLDASLVGRAGGDRFTPDHLALAAADVARDVDWSGADPQILLAVIGAAAPVDAVTAGYLLDAYVPAPAAPDGRQDDLSSQECLARAALAGAQGRRADQLAAIRRAAKIPRDNGNHFAEVAALLALLEVEADEEGLNRADELTSVVPRSWLRRRYESLAERARGPEQLSPAELRVMYAICEGRSTADIAQHFGRSKNTIRNQTRRVYEVMDVRTRSALVSKCAAMDLIPHK
jgi:DNA-binding CsgD family transcriptional regulator